jgi:hypothetical protein
MCVAYLNTLSFPVLWLFGGEGGGARLRPGRRLTYISDIRTLSRDALPRGQQECLIARLPDAL